MRARIRTRSTRPSCSCTAARSRPRPGFPRAPRCWPCDDQEILSALRALRLIRRVVEGMRAGARAAHPWPLFFYMPFWFRALSNQGGTLTVQGRGNTRLRYRFANLGQARAHVHDAGGALFFVPDEKMCLLPDASVCLSLSFESGEGRRTVDAGAGGGGDDAG